MKYLNVKYRSWSCQDNQKLQNNASSRYPATIFAHYFLQFETPLFRIHVFRTIRLIHMPTLSWLQNLTFKLGALRREKRRGSAFYTGTCCLNVDTFIRLFATSICIFTEKINRIMEARSPQETNIIFLCFANADNLHLCSKQHLVLRRDNTKQLVTVYLWRGQRLREIRTAFIHAQLHK